MLDKLEQVSVSSQLLEFRIARRLRIQPRLFLLNYDFMFVAKLFLDSIFGAVSNIFRVT